MLAETHFLLDLPKVFSRTVGLLYIIDLDRGPIVSVSDVLFELRSVSDQFTFNSVDERTGSLVEAICSTNLFKKPQIK